MTIRFQLKRGSALEYRVADYNAKIHYTFELTKDAPGVVFKWRMKGAADRGSLKLSERSRKSARSFSPLLGKVGGDVAPAFLFPTDFHGRLKRSEPTTISSLGRVIEFTASGSTTLPLRVNGTRVPVLALTARGEDPSGYPYRIWLLDDANWPVLLRMEEAGGDNYWSLEAALGVETAPAASAPLPKKAPTRASKAKVEIVSSGFPRPSSIAIGAESLYWTSFDENKDKILCCPITGGKPSLFLKSSSARDLVADSKRLYWIQGAKLLSVALGGGRPSTLATASPDFGFISAVTLGETDVFWTEEHDAGYSIHAVPKTGGASRRLVKETPVPVALCVSGRWLYWTSLGDDTVRRIAIAGGKNETIGSVELVWALTAAGDSVIVWASKKGIYSMTRGRRPSLLVEDRDLTNAGAVAAGRLHWATWRGIIKSAALDGSDVSLWAKNQHALRGVLAAGSYLYWANLGDGDADSSIARCAIT